ncbi:MAG: DUF2089 domain-containing protein [Propionibacteriaceae bacterium]|nr:DUF2089 domain-containing protein [Propionibacteriaceae bacterium]
MSPDAHRHVAAHVHTNTPTHRALADCPVCGEGLATTRLGCAACGTELVGQFAPCPFCALDDADFDLLRVFVTARGNLKELQSHLGVSYPTARARFNDVLTKLGWAGEATESDEGDPDTDQEDPAESPSDEADATASETPDAVRDQVLAQVAAGTLSPAVAADLLAHLT